MKTHRFYPGDFINSSRTHETKEQLADRMAAVIVEKTRAGHECTETDLYLAGFDERDIARCLPLAQRFAALSLSKKA